MTVGCILDDIWSPCIRMFIQITYHPTIHFSLFTLCKHEKLTDIYFLKLLFVVLRDQNWTECVNHVCVCVCGRRKSVILNYLLRSNAHSSLYLLRISSKLDIDWLKVSRSITKQVTPSAESEMMFAVRKSSLEIEWKRKWMIIILSPIVVNRKAIYNLKI